MAIMEWTKDLSVNIAEIDAQHKRLLTLINDLDDALHSNQQQVAIGKILKELLDYTQTHFAYEEELLNKYSYPAYDGHKAEHDALAEKVVFLNQMFREGDQPEPDQLMAFLTIWLKDHIMGMDKSYSDFLVEKGVK